MLYHIKTLCYYKQFYENHKHLVKKVTETNNNNYPLFKQEKKMENNKPQKNKIIFITDNWGPTHGGINLFNTDFSKALAEIVSDDYEILCAVTSFDDDDQKDAGLVKLIALDSDLSLNCVRIINDIRCLYRAIS